jgi:hypothetical protein
LLSLLLTLAFFLLSLSQEVEGRSMEEERVKGEAAAALPLEAEARAAARPAKRRASWVRRRRISSPLLSRQAKGGRGGKHKGRASTPHSQSSHTIDTEEEKRRVSWVSGALATSTTTFCSRPVLSFSRRVKLAMALQEVEDGGDGEEEDDDGEGMMRGRS